MISYVANEPPLDPVPLVTRPLCSYFDDENFISASYVWSANLMLLTRAACMLNRIFLYLIDPIDPRNPSSLLPSDIQQIEYALSAHSAARVCTAFLIRDRKPRERRNAMSRGILWQTITNMKSNLPLKVDELRFNATVRSRLP